MAPREERGLVIAATCRLHRKPDGTWAVPSQSQENSMYVVNLETKACTCPDCTESARWQRWHDPARRHGGGCVRDGRGLHSIFGLKRRGGRG
jgi:hypothetical protein